MVFDVAVIGGGPAGMMAAAIAAKSGAKLVLVEKNKELGRKLLLTGKGRCNITHFELDSRKFVEKFERPGKFLLSPLSVFGIKETIEFFEKRGLKTKVERGKRVFPESNRAQDILNILIDFLKKNGVTIMTNSKVIGLKKLNNRITSVLTKNNKKITADKYILCTGGKTYPDTGSTGDGFRWAKQLGHSVTKLKPALVPLKIKEEWPKDAQGLKMKNVKLGIFQNNKKQDTRFGEVLFTHFGISGPIVLDMSKKIGELLGKGKVKLSLDLKPALDFFKLDRRLQRDFREYQNRMFKNSLSGLLPKKLIPVVVELSGINPSKQVNSITKKERYKLVNLLKGLEMTVTGLLGFNKAIITNGGISLKEIDSKTMKSKLTENLFFAGEVIDLDGPTGGYNLQLCWTTGYVAGKNAASKFC